ncbi:MULTISPECIES: bifunctional 4-hydroxy-2-oxoglutarate aldolase/2-dehydro-3-deoxy-phosphogluconate aldolase [Bacillus]|uniref:Bifunctional 4-hydroxy-2-oxoglutarate aldolase/2-dehydro-3-deoxy-phosphogluconate aldolase n=1 Tax=Bacillus glycinifermentans TaxID=1664069 RepID=A0AAJ3Z3G4_9BACI|nr:MULTISPECIES: bifunctional 4-hydroxy-2-oxoglutarate aldolase/2-dehydro-3-deoxy-phosphogluconate aldolase [Bacillus]KKB73953.1 2-dehydro-3-deoxyphosphogluconate aldolase [Bacillus sp. TH008]MDU0072481.1 bifunctional 4-hydroxy-2-oxoglutarate aldolase/2-dehydro-3-deoxy-phosphogluconate aldolase [Bacillus sp. IG6]MED8020319.1 bifunctional 4-hydroxy-2-oxoglutarate aldolase/2-dehydro-3-deoxy-phosphogluconate aldolase [Bacillus glycinifermentans]QAT67477.1 bifunctional 4-hydroxy-2-oxoglutarate aldo
MEALSQIEKHKVIAIVRGYHADDAIKIAEALKEGGIRLVEMTLNSPQALKAIEAVSERYGDDMLVGAGTVLDAESARAALSAGARFILSPTVNEETIKLTKRYGAVSIPGAFTPTEILTAYESGGDIIKVFPGTMGPGYIKDIHGPLPQIPLLPTGGVGLDNIREYLDAGAVGAGIGGALVKTNEEVTGPYLENLKEKAKQFVEAIKRG